MSKNITLTWELPTTRTAGGALPVEDIRDTVVEASADGGANFTTIDTVAPTDPQTAFVPDAEIGEWQFRLTVFDKANQPSAAHIEVVVVLDDSPPNPVTNVVAVQS